MNWLKNIITPFRKTTTRTDSYYLYIDYYVFGIKVARIEKTYELGEWV